MLRFLSRDSSNAQALVNLKRKAEATSVISKVKKTLHVTPSAEPNPAPGPSSVKIQHKLQTLASTEVEAIVNAFVEDELYLGFSNTAHESDTVVIPTGVQAVIEQLRRTIEIKYNEKKVVVPREQIISWIEQAVHEADIGQR